MVDRRDRLDIASRRLVNVLSTQKIALGRTLEHKIADAGPYTQRIDPHLITQARRQLEAEGRIIRLHRRNTPWFHLHDTPHAILRSRLEELEPIHDQIRKQPFLKRVGQALEIASYRVFYQHPTFETLGRYYDIDAHDDSQLYRKEEPPSSIGRNQISGDQRLDFLTRHPSAGWAGVEIKNIREWLYPNRGEIVSLLAKCVSLDALPVLIGRRIPYVTRRILNPCGVLVWETYNQRYPATEQVLAAQASAKNLLGFHDIRLGNEPGPHLTHFIADILPAEMPSARERFEAYKDLLKAYAFGEMPYDQFAARVRRREQGTIEDHDWDEETPIF